MARWKCGMIFRSALAKFENAATRMFNPTNDFVGRIALFEYLRRSAPTRNYGNFKGFTTPKHSLSSRLVLQSMLKEITDTDELKVTLYAIWRIEHMDGPFRALCETDFDAKDLDLATNEVASGLEKACQRGSLLKSQHDTDTFYF